jgi:hypothetical protein
MYMETNLTSYVGRGDPDFGIGLSAGLTYSF